MHTPVLTVDKLGCHTYVGTRRLRWDPRSPTSGPASLRGGTHQQILEGSDGCHGLQTDWFITRIVLQALHNCSTCIA